MMLMGGGEGSNLVVAQLGGHWTTKEEVVRFNTSTSYSS